MRFAMLLLNLAQETGAGAGDNRTNKPAGAVKEYGNRLCNK